MLLFFSALDEIKEESEKEIVENIYYRYSNHVKAMISVFDRNENRADDLLQDVFCKVVKYRHDFIGKNESGIKLPLFLMITRDKIFVR